MENKNYLDSCFRNLEMISKVVLAERYKDFHTDYQEQVGKVQKHLSYIRNLLAHTSYVDDVLMLTARHLESISYRWKVFWNENRDVAVSILKDKYRLQLERTLQNLSDVWTILNANLSSEKDLPQKENLRFRDIKEEQQRLQELNNRRKELQQQYEQESSSEAPDEEKLQAMKKQLEAYGASYVDSRRRLDAIKLNSEEEQNLRQRIIDGFKDLSTDTHLDDELKKLRWEYCGFTIAIAILVIFFLVGYGFFICRLSFLHLHDFADYMPYSISVPIFAALLWMFVYLRNRAHKLSIELSSKLYNIHYLEGLMKMSNSISMTTEEALQRIEHIVNSMVDSFLKGISQSAQTSDQISSIEKMELKDNPYWKFLTELKEIIKLIKHEQ